MKKQSAVRVLNLYACLGGNRLLCKNCEVTAVELDTELAAAAIWWERLSPLKREFFESKYGKIDAEKINEIYKIHTDWSSEDLEQVSSCS